MTYRILITGSRTWGDDNTVRKAIADVIDQADSSGEREFTIVHGACPQGADAHAAAYCKDQSSWTLTEERHPARWAAPCTPRCRPTHRRRRADGVTYCPYAGIARNQHMVDLGANICLAFIRDHSRGATDCARRAARAGIPVKEWRA